MVDKTIEQIDWTPHPLAEFFDMLDDAALNDLAADIKKNGLRESIKVWDGRIHDGRNRYEACKRVGVKPTIEGLNLRDENEAADYVISRNLKRRHLTVPQRSIIAGKIAALKRGQTQIGTGADLKTQAQTANMLDVSERSVRNAKAVLKSGDAELVADVKAGKVSLRKAAETARRPEPARNDIEQTAAVADANTRKQARTDARINKRDVRVVFKQLSHADRQQFIDEVIGVDDVVGWLAKALDSERLRIADAAFDSIKAKTARHGHERVVYAWLEETRG
jgi:hypothetical protein